MTDSVFCCAGSSLYSSSGSGRGRAAELEHLRDAVRHKEDQIASLQDQLTRLEATRDRWSSGMHGGHALCARQCVFPEAPKTCMLHVYLTAPDRLIVSTAQLAAKFRFACCSSSPCLRLPCVHAAWRRSLLQQLGLKVQLPLRGQHAQDAFPCMQLG